MPNVSRKHRAIVLSFETIWGGFVCVGGRGGGGGGGGVAACTDVTLVTDKL